jgi:hypothetical protein
MLPDSLSDTSSALRVAADLPTAVNRGARETYDYEYLQRFAIVYEYPVSFTRDLFNAANPTFAETLRRAGPRRHKVDFFLDAGLASADPGLRDRIAAYAAAHPAILNLVADPESSPAASAARMMAPSSRVSRGA